MDETEWQFRPFMPADADNVVALWDLAQLTRKWNDPYKDLARKIEQMNTSDSSVFWVVECNKQIIGAVMAGYDGHRASVNYLAVHPDFQHKGIGRMLMMKVESWCLELNCPKINLMVRSDNLAVQEFYRHLSYQQDDVVVMSKRLIPDS